ncbi:hypothetical protein P7K49_029262 [Saguinus oedipus]|uniref:Uncharacterized protein n=1 Tax=Saguinus oedipus TaxID=9490 RepID=A0ABQ9U6P1_SAGOE|nr:hypothetical protein P7K49_029262 [Saguinus oedipus]
MKRMVQSKLEDTSKVDAYQAFDVPVACPGKINCRGDKLSGNSHHDGPSFYSIALLDAESRAHAILLCAAGVYTVLEIYHTEIQLIRHG